MGDKQCKMCLEVKPKAAFKPDKSMSDGVLNFCRSCFAKRYRRSEKRILKGIWYQMVSRCHNESSKDYKYYGARGIYVCDEWKNSFDCFMNDVGLRKNDEQLDRIDNNGP